MKKTFTLLLALFTIMLAACSNATFAELEPLPIPERPDTWQGQVERVKNNNNSRSRSGQVNPVLVEATYLGVIESQDDINALMHDLFDDNTDFLLYNPDMSYFEILKVGDIVKGAQELGINDPFESLKEEIRGFVCVGMELIKLEWFYEGKTYYSIAIASNEEGGILYDHIGQMITEKASEQEMQELISSTIPLSRTGGEQPVTIPYSNANASREGNFWTGTNNWSYVITAYSTFGAFGVLKDRQTKASSHANRGWACEAGCQTISGELDRSTFHEFGWGWGYGQNVNINISWGGTGFSISGASTKHSGTEVHRAGS